MSASVDGPGTGDGFVLFCEGKTDISDASRQIEHEEATACKEAGINYVGARDRARRHHGDDEPGERRRRTASTSGDLYALFGPESDGFDNWSDANALAKKVGGNGNFPDAPADDHGARARSRERTTRSSTLAGIEDTAARAGRPGGQGRVAALRTTSRAPNDNVIIQGIEGSDTSLGFVGFAYADQQGESVKKLQIDGGDGCVEPIRRHDLRRQLPVVAARSTST